MANDSDIALTDLEVIQQFSLAVRGATAPREDVIRALEADLAYLTGGSRRSARPAVAAAPAKVTPPRTAPTKAAPTRSGPTKAAAAKPAATGSVRAAAKRTPAKKATRRA